MTNPTDDMAANDVDDNGATGGRLHDAASAVRDAASAAKGAAGDAYATAREKVSDALGAARDKSGAAYETARNRAGEAYGTARDKAGVAYETARDKANEAYDAARDKASQARSATADGIEGNPLAAVIGGVALGLLVGALLPRSRREADALGPLASRLGDTARAAATAAREAGRQTLDELGVNKDAAIGQVEKLVDTALKAATSAGTAAAEAVHKPD